MLRTLFLIPHEVAGIPVAGFGWLLIALAVALGVRLWFARRRGVGIGAVLASEGFIWAVVAAVIVFVLPAIELRNVDGDPIGMAIRGYGMMLLAGVCAAVGLAAYRAKVRGIDPDIILSMAPWAFVGGILGARLFFVIQYRDQFIADTWSETLGNMFRFTEGGLVVYGSFIGGFVALSYYVLKHRLPWFRMGDVIVPCLFIGVFFGRMGCLMNGCCYGGRCEDQWYALEFPPTSAVYHDQVASGELLGFRYDPETRQIVSVDDDSLADEAGIEVGQNLQMLANDPTVLENASREIPREDARTGVVATVNGKRYRWTPEQLPDRAYPVYAAQLLSSISALALCLALCAIPQGKFRDGTVMMLGFAGYAVIRFALEIVRVDEAGQFGTELSISQWVSIVVFILALFGLAWIYRNRQRVAPATSAGTDR